MSCTWRPGPDDELARIARAFAGADDEPEAEDGPGGPVPDAGDAQAPSGGAGSRSRTSSRSAAPVDASTR